MMDKRIVRMYELKHMQARKLAHSEPLTTANGYSCTRSGNARKHLLMKLRNKFAYGWVNLCLYDFFRSASACSQCALKHEGN